MNLLAWMLNADTEKFYWLSGLAGLVVSAWYMCFSDDVSMMRYLELRC